MVADSAMSMHSGATSSEPSWRGFSPGRWRSEIDVRGFIVSNASPTRATRPSLRPVQEDRAVWAKLQPYFHEERKKGVLDVDAARPRRCWRTRPATSTATTR